MIRPLLALPLALLTIGPILRAEPGADVRTAATTLARSSYTWETTGRQRFTSESRELRPNPNAPVEVRGRADPEGYTEITLLPSRELALPVTAVFRGGDVVGETPLGWLRRTAMRQTPGQDRTVEAGGKPVRLARIFAVALQVTARRTAAEELLDLIEEVKAWRSESGLVVGELPDRSIERLWDDPQAKRAPDVHGTVIFRLSEAGVTEYHVVLAIGFPNRQTQKTVWTMRQWSTRFTGLGTTRVDPPAAARKVLEEDDAR